MKQAEPILNRPACAEGETDMDTEGITINGITYSDDMATVLAADSNIPSFDLIRGVRYIGKYAFADCKNLPSAPRDHVPAFHELFAAPVAQLQGIRTQVHPDHIRKKHGFRPPLIYDYSKR